MHSYAVCLIGIILSLGTVSVVSVFTTQLEKIQTNGTSSCEPTLTFLSEDNEFAGSTPLLLCDGYLLGRIVIPNMNFIYQLSVCDKFDKKFAYTKRASVKRPRKPYILQNILDGSVNKTISIGSKAYIYFGLKSTFAATSELNFSINVTTCPTQLELEYRPIVTVKPDDIEIFAITIETKDTDMLGSYVVKVTAEANSEEFTLTNSQHTTLVRVSCTIYLTYYSMLP